jgi:homoserine kinase type II
MGLFTRLSDADLALVARTFALGEVRAAAGVEAGTVNSNYRLETARGVFFARVNEGKAEEDVAYEAELVDYLAARGVATPPALRADDARPWAKLPFGLVTVFPWIDARPLSTSALAAADCARAGEALARLHTVAAGFLHRRESRYRFDAIVARWRGLPAAPPGSPLALAIADTGDEIARLEAVQAERASLPRGVIHGDLFVDNVLVDARGEFVLLDFEQASDGTLAYDLAVCVNAWCYTSTFQPARAQALVAGYQRVRPLGADERAGLFTEARAAAMRFTVTRITDVELDPRATPTVKATKDFRRYHARLVELRGLGDAGFSRLVGLA